MTEVRADHLVADRDQRLGLVGGQVDVGAGAEADQAHPLAPGHQRAHRGALHDAAGDQAGPLRDRDRAVVGVQHRVRRHVVLRGGRHGVRVAAVDRRSSRSPGRPPAPGSRARPAPTGRRRCAGTRPRRAARRSSAPPTAPCRRWPPRWRSGRSGRRAPGRGRTRPPGAAASAGHQPQLRLRPRAPGQRGQAQGDAGRGHTVGVDVHGAGHRHARRPVRRGQGRPPSRCRPG